MKKNLKILTFFLIPLTVFALLEIMARQMFLPHSDMPLKFRDFNEQKEKVEVLFMGNSHIEKGTNPDLLQIPSFTLAYSAQDLYYNYKIFKKHLPQMDSLKTLMIGIDPFSFYYDESVNSMYFVKDYFFYEKILPQNGFSFQFFLNSSVFWLNRGKFFSKLIKGDFENNGYPYLKSYHHDFRYKEGQYLVSNGQRLAVGRMSETELKKDADNTISRILNNSNLEIFEKNKSYLEKMIRLANERNIKVFIAFAPVSSFYRRQIPEFFTSTTLSVISQWLDKYPKMKFYDFSAIFEKNPEFFYNSDHLNSKGSEVFTRKLLRTF